MTFKGDHYKTKNFLLPLCCYADKESDRGDWKPKTIITVEEAASKSECSLGMVDPMAPQHFPERKADGCGTLLHLGKGVLHLCSFII